MNSLAPAPLAADAPERAPTDWRAAAMERRLRRRYRSERRFRRIGLAAVLLSGGFLAFLLATMLANGVRGFGQTVIALPVKLGPTATHVDSATLAKATVDAATAAYGAQGPSLLADGAWTAVRERFRAGGIPAHGRIIVDVPAATAIDMAAKGEGSPAAKAIVARLAATGQLHTRFNWPFLAAADSTDPAIVGIWGALKGSFFTMVVTLALAFPVGVLAALYLEEYAPRNRLTDLIEVSINNLAAVPSIIFGLLGLAVFLGTWNLPRSSALVGGLTLALMTMPVIVIASRSAIRAVPPSIRDAALGIGASPVQVVFHHVLPLAMPGILTGTIIGMARALGETAPLLMIGMRAFIAAPPGGFTDPATVLPVQVFLWSDEVSRGFIEKTSAAIIVLLVFLLAMNGAAIYLRNRFETRW